MRLSKLCRPGLKGARKASIAQGMKKLAYGYKKCVDLQGDCVM